MCLQKIYKNMLPVFDFHKILLSYSKHIWAVFLLKWYLDKGCNVLKVEFKIRLNTQYTVEYWGT